MRVAIRFDVYTLSTHGTEIPDLVFLFRLFIAFIQLFFSYLLDIGHLKLEEAQRVLNEVSKRYPSQVLKALFQQVVLVFGKPTGHDGVALLIPYPGWWFVATLYHFSASPAQSNLVQPVIHHINLPYGLPNRLPLSLP